MMHTHAYKNELKYLFKFNKYVYMLLHKNPNYVYAIMSKRFTNLSDYSILLNIAHIQWHLTMTFAIKYIKPR